MTKELIECHEYDFEFAEFLWFKEVTQNKCTFFQFVCALRGQGHNTILSLYEKAKASVMCFFYAVNSRTGTMEKLHYYPMEGGD